MAKRSEVDDPQKPRRGGRWPAHLVGLVWMSHLTTVMLEMVTPAVFGHWLDRRFGTTYLTLTGLVIGPPLGVFHIYWLLKTEGWLTPPPKRTKLAPTNAPVPPASEAGPTQSGGPTGGEADDSTGG